MRIATGSTVIVFDAESAIAHGISTEELMKTYDAVIDHDAAHSAPSHSLFPGNSEHSTTNITFGVQAVPDDFVTSPDRVSGACYLDVKDGSPVLVRNSVFELKQSDTTAVTAAG